MIAGIKFDKNSPPRFAEGRRSMPGQPRHRVGASSMPARMTSPPWGASLVALKTSSGSSVGSGPSTTENLGSVAVFFPAEGTGCLAISRKTGSGIDQETAASESWLSGRPFDKARWMEMPTSPRITLDLERVWSARVAYRPGWSP